MESVTVVRKRVDYLVLLVSIVPLLGFAVAIWLLWPWGFDLTSLVLFLVFYVLSALGITVGYHRLFTHSSFKTYPAVKFLFGILGSMAVEGRIVDWVSDHRKHHQCSDDEGDPHSPVFGRVGIWQRFAGFIHAHYGWLLFAGKSRDRNRYVSDLLQDKVVAAVDRLFLVWVLGGLLLPGVIGGFVAYSWRGALLGFLWGGLARMFLVHHVTWSTNSICHMFGTRPFRSQDDSRNNSVVGILALGEGWHNNHHAFPKSARHGLSWWQFDLSWIVIRLLKICRLAWDVYTPSKWAIEAKRATAA